MLHECCDLLRRQRACEAVLFCFIYFVVIVSSARPEDAEFFPGTLPLDTDGKEVQAHGGGIIKVKDTFYWFGESYKRPLLHDFLSEGVNLYSSTDLATWRYEGLVFNGTAEIQGVPGGPPYRIERPKILYNKQYNRFVLLFHSDTSTFAYPTVGVAMAEEITGPYEWVRVFHPDGFNSFDMGVFQEDNGTAYLVRSVNNEYVGISQLTPDYTNTMGISTTVPRAEGPALFKSKDGSYFLMGSHLTGWAPNPPLLFHTYAPSLDAAGAWTKLPTPATGDDANITYNSQSTFVFPLEFEDGTVLYIYMGDRWNFYTQKSVESASYVWLPLLPRADGLGYELLYETSWRPIDYRERARWPVHPANGTPIGNGTANSASTEAARAKSDDNVNGAAPAAGVRPQGEAGALNGGEPIGAAAERTPASPPQNVLTYNLRHPIPTGTSGLSRASTSNSTAARSVVQQLGHSMSALVLG